MRGRLRSAGSLIAESTGMTSWEHGVLASTDPGLKLGLQTRQLTGSAALRWLRRACASVRRCVAAIQDGGLQGSNGTVRAAVHQPSSPFVWIGREKVRSLLRWAGLQNLGRETDRQRDRQRGACCRIFRGVWRFQHIS